MLKILIFIFSVNAFAHTSDACRKIDYYLKSVIPIPATSIFLSAANADLVLIGENHGEVDTLGVYTLALNSIEKKNANINRCLFLEVNSNEGAALVNMSNVTKFDKLSCRDCVVWYETFAKASGLGWKTYAIDADEPYHGADASVQSRDDIMAKRIKELWASGACKTGLGIFGKHHLMSGSGVYMTIGEWEHYGKRRSLKEQLNQVLSLSTVELVVDPKSFGFEVPNAQSEKLCNEEIKATPPIGIGWINSSRSTIPTYFYEGHGSDILHYSEFSEFNFSLMVH